MRGLQLPSGFESLLETSDCPPNDRLQTGFSFLYPTFRMHFQGWTGGSVCHEAGGVEKLCESSSFYFIFVFIPRAHGGSKEARLFFYSLPSPPSHLGDFYLPSNYYIPHSPSPHFLFVLSPHDGWPTGEMEQRERVRDDLPWAMAPSNKGSAPVGKYNMVVRGGRPRVKIPAQAQRNE